MAQQTEHIVDTNKMMTAVEWLALRYHQRQGYLSQDDIAEAKAMEESQIMNTWYACKLSIIDKLPMDAKDYFNITYNK